MRIKRAETGTRNDFGPVFLCLAMSITGRAVLNHSKTGFTQVLQPRLTHTHAFSPTSLPKVLCDDCICVAPS